jgi:hypothetical protein
MVYVPFISLYSDKEEQILNFFSSFLHFELKNDLDMEPDPDSLKRA